MNTSVTSTVKGVVIHNEKSPLMCLYRKVYVRKAELSVGLPYSYHFYPRPVLGIGYWVLSLPVCVCINHLLVRTITRHLFKLGSPNLVQRSKTP